MYFDEIYSKEDRRKERRMLFESSLLRAIEFYVRKTNLGRVFCRFSQTRSLIVTNRCSNSAQTQGEFRFEFEHRSFPFFRPFFGHNSLYANSDFKTMHLFLRQFRHVRRCALLEMSFSHGLESPLAIDTEIIRIIYHTIYC